MVKLRKVKKQLIQFTAYSGTYYLFITYSTECPHCEDMLTGLEDFLTDYSLEKRVRIVLLSQERFDRKGFDQFPGFYSLKIDYEDMVQFGLNTPSIYFVNGKGKRLFHALGYKEGGFAMIKDRIESIFSR